MSQIPGPSAPDPLRGAAFLLCSSPCILTAANPVISLSNSEVCRWHHSHWSLPTGGRWCSQNNLELNILKTVTMVVDFRNNLAPRTSTGSWSMSPSSPPPPFGALLTLPRTRADCSDSSSLLTTWLTVFKLFRTCTPPGPWGAQECGGHKLFESFHSDRRMPSGPKPKTDR